MIYNFINKNLINKNLINKNPINKNPINKNPINKNPINKNLEWEIKNTNISIENNVSLDLIEKYYYKWNYEKLSENPNLTEKFILNYPHQNWDIEYLIKNNKITDFKALSKFKYLYEYILNIYPNKPWDWEWLIENTDIDVEKYISLDLIEKYNNNLKYLLLSTNKNITEEFILKHPYKNWDIEYLIKNNKITNFNSFSKFKNISFYIIHDYPNKPWNWEWLIKYTDIHIEEYIPFDLIEKYKEKWNYWKLSYNPNLTEEFILKYPNKDWNIKYLINKVNNLNTLIKSKNINININDYPNKPWDWEWLIENTNINVEKYIPFNLIKKYSYKWNYYYLSENLNITEEFILKYPYKNWNINYLIENNKITDFNALSKFKNINQDIINKYSNKSWDYKWLFENTDINILYYKFNKPILKNKRIIYPINHINDNLLILIKKQYNNWNIKYLLKNNKITNFKILSKFKSLHSYTINNYPNKPWDWEWLIENTNIDVEKHISLELLEKYSCKWNYIKLHKNPKITEKFILNHPYQDWNIRKLIKNNKITNFKSLSKFKNINQYIIDEYPSKQWDWIWLIENTNIIIEKYIPFNLIEKYPYKWNYYYLSYNPNILLYFILNNFDKDWNIEYLIKNNKITDFNALSKFKYLNEYIINKYPNKPWDWEWMILNTNINLEKYIPFNLIEKYPYKWNYNILKDITLTKKFIKKFFFKIKY